MVIKVWNENEIFFFISDFLLLQTSTFSVVSGWRLWTFPCFSCTELRHGNWREKRDECLMCMFLEVALCNSSLKKKKSWHSWPNDYMLFLVRCCHAPFSLLWIFFIQCIDYSSLQIICLLGGRTAHRFKLHKILWNKQTLKEKQA